jgi:predicted nucleic acid-binding Zn ribbon protein
VSDEIRPDADELADPEEAARLRPLSGIDLAKAALARAREQARERGDAAPRRRGYRHGGRAGAGGRREPGEPQPLGEAIDRLLADRGWDVPAAVVGVVERWSEIAGAELAAHCRPEKFDSGVLALRAESTAWATQVRLLVPQLRRRLDEVVGRGVVTRIEVRGPTGPDWGRGPLRVRGRGPRDTYG